MVNLQPGPVINKINEIRFTKEFLSYICDLLAIVLFICIVLVLVFFIVIFQILSIIFGKVLALTFLTLTELCELLFCCLLLSTLSQIIIGRNSRELFFTIIALHFPF